MVCYHQDCHFDVYFFRKFTLITLVILQLVLIKHLFIVKSSKIDFDSVDSISTIELYKLNLHYHLLLQYNYHMRLLELEDNKLDLFIGQNCLRNIMASLEQQVSDKMVNSKLKIIEYYFYIIIKALVEVDNSFGAEFFE